MKKASTQPLQAHYVRGISAIDGMEGHEFEHFCADLLRKVGFSEVTVTPGSGDQGVDVLAVKNGIKYAIQCKNYASALSNTPVQEVSAGKQFYGCTNYPKCKYIQNLTPDIEK
jgi:restriction system protein